MSQHEPERWLMVIFTATQLIFRPVPSVAHRTEPRPLFVQLAGGAATSEACATSRAATGAGVAAVKLVITRPTTSVMSIYGCCSERDDIYCPAELDIGGLGRPLRRLQYLPIARQLSGTFLCPRSQPPAAAKSPAFSSQQGF